MNQSQLDDGGVRELLSAVATPLDPNAVAACSEGVGEADETARLRADPETALLLRLMRQDAQRGRRLTMAVGAAAAVLVAGVLLWMGARSHEAAAPALETQLARMGAALRAEAPQLFDGFEPRLLDARAEIASAMRGGGRWIAPRGVVLEPPTRLRWESPPGATRVEVSIRGNDVQWTREVEGRQVDAPVLKPGRYVVTLRALDALGGQRTRRGFTVASRELRAELERARSLIRARAPAGLADLLEAQYALHRGLFELAEEAAGRAMKYTPELQVQAARVLARTRDT